MKNLFSTQAVTEKGRVIVTGYGRSSEANIHCAVCGVFHSEMGMGEEDISGCRSGRQRKMLTGSLKTSQCFSHFLKYIFKTFETNFSLLKSIQKLSI